MRFLRSALGLSLALLVAFTSVSLAVARAQPRPVGEIVICTGLGLQTIAVDEEGRPVGRPHVCPDGVAALLALVEVTAPDEAARPIRRVALWQEGADLREGRAVLRARARAPPQRRA